MKRNHQDTKAPSRVVLAFLSRDLTAPADVHPVSSAWCLGVLVVSLLLSAGRAGAQPVASLDYSWCLAPAGGAPLLEVNLMVQRSSLRWRPQDGGLQGGWEARLLVEKEGRALADTSWSRVDWRGEDSPVGAAEKVPDQVRLALPASAAGGRLRVLLRDLAEGRVEEKSLRLGAPAGTLLGGLCLGVAPPDPATEGPFLRGAWRFLPYADAIYGAGLDTLRGLVEIRPDGSADSLELGLAILGEGRNRLESRLPRPLGAFVLQTGDPLRLAFALPVDRLPSGSYHLEIELLEQGLRRDLLRKAFWVHNPDLQAPERSLAVDEFATADPGRLERQWEAAQVLASHYEQEAWERLDLEGRRAFLREFWFSRDPDPGTLVNEEQVALLARVEEARRRWTEPGQQGALSGRGRIFVKYGEPDAVETDFGALNSRFDFQLAGGDENAAGSGHRDFELWLYNRLEGGVAFIFIDERGFGTFELAHSTKSGEFFDPQWSRKLFAR